MVPTAGWLSFLLHGRGTYHVLGHTRTRPGSSFLLRQTSLALTRPLTNRDSKSLTEERESSSYDRKAEELLGEAKENLSKVKTTITTSTAISNVHHLSAYIANICAVIEAQFVCDLSLKDIHTPAMFVVARTFALHLS